MQLHRTILALSLALLAGNAAAQNPNPWQTGALPVPANRIVGLWQADVTTGPCAGGPIRNFIAFNTYHAGGTLSDTNPAPPWFRGPGQGIWRYEGRGKYEVRFQFNRYLPDGSFDGVQDVGGTVQLAPGGNSYVHDVRTRTLNADGSVRVELCGSALAERIGIH